MSRFFLIAQESHTLPYAIPLDAESFETAATMVSGLEDGRLVFTPSILIDLNSGEARRVFKDSPSSWAISDTAFSAMGANTPDEYFQETGTMEVAE